MKIETILQGFVNINLETNENIATVLPVVENKKK